MRLAALTDTGPLPFRRVPAVGGSHQDRKEPAMQQPAPIDSRIRTWTLQRELVRASLASTARGHVLAPARGRMRPVSPSTRRPR